MLLNLNSVLRNANLHALRKYNIEWAEERQQHGIFMTSPCNRKSSTTGQDYSRTYCRACFC